MSLPAARALCQSLASELRAFAAGEPGLSPFVEGLGAFGCAPRSSSEPPRQAQAARTHLRTVLDALQCGPGLAEAIRAFAPTTDWYRILDGAGVDPALEEGLMVGRPEPVPDAPARVGLFLIAPGVHYPLHTHAAHEVYYVVSGEVGIRHGITNEPLRIGAPGYRITPPNRVHALTTGEAPCLIAYVWTGDLAAPGWWWEQDDAGAWQRVRWMRGDDGRWTAQSREPVSEAAWREAGES